MLSSLQNATLKMKNVCLIDTIRTGNIRRKYITDVIYYITIFKNIVLNTFVICLLI